MRVISQDKTLSLDFEGNIYRCENKYIYVRIDNSDKYIGQYETEARAESVFAEMHREYEEEMLNLPHVTIYRMPKR